MAAKFLVPALPPWVVPRRRLVDRMSRGSRGQLTLLVAPAGCGKTVLAASWVTAGTAPGPIAWLSLDEGDDQPGLFWSYVLTALSRRGVLGPDIGRPVRVDRVEQSLLIRLAADLSERPEPIVLILDNAEVLTHPAVLNGLDFVLRHTGPQLKLIVLARDELALPLHRYRLTGSVTQLRLEDLAFTPEEGRALLTAQHADLPQDAMIEVADWAQGWAAGLRLAALSLPSRPATGQVHLRGGHSELTAYFLAEFLNVQSPEVRELLLQTCVVDKVWCDLADSLTGRRNAATILPRLAHASAFVMTRAEDNGCYEYHPLIRELLRFQLHEEAPRKVGQLHRRAARWLAEAGHRAEAIQHAVAGADWELAAWLLVEDHGIGHLLAGPSGSGYAGTFAGMPTGTAGPEAAVIQAATALIRLDGESCAKHLLRGRELVADGPTEHTRALHLALALTEAVSAYARGDLDGALSALSAAEDLLGGTAPATLNTVLIPFLRGRVLLAAGDLADAGAAFTAGLRAFDGPGGEFLRAGCLGQLALVEAHGGHLRKAADLARRAHAAADRCALPITDRPPAADVALAWVRAEEYDLGSARSFCDRAGAATGISTDPVTFASLALVRARLHRARGDLAGAVQAVTRAAETPTGTPVPGWITRRLAAGAAVWGAGRKGSQHGIAAPLSVPDGPEPAPVMLASAAIKLAGGDVAGASDIVAEALRQPQLPLDARIDGSLLTATCELAAGRIDLARRALAEALASAAPERLRRPFIEASPRLRRFLRQDRELAEQHTWLGTPVTGTAHAVSGRARATTSGTPVVEVLTDKEMEVLHHLAVLLSTEEIARKMFVSVNTVKTHVRGILRKLAASRRNEAVRRAQELGLVQRPGPQPHP